MKARSRLDVLRRMLREAGEGQYSVIPLFNQADRQHGQLVKLEGTVRRAVKILVDSDRGRPANRDIATRLGIGHYYELELFPSDSQNNPVVFCVRDLPPGFPVGLIDGERVRVAGFFFKSWAYRPQGTPSGENRSGSSSARALQVAPLLIGREPTWLKRASVAESPYVGILTGGLFVLVLLVIWVALWRLNRGDREFQRKVLLKRHAMGDGASLSELEVSDKSQDDLGDSMPREP